MRCQVTKASMLLWVLFIAVFVTTLRTPSIYAQEMMMLRSDGDSFYCLAISPDNRFVAASGFPHTAIVWDLKTGKSVRFTPGGNGIGVIPKLAFTRDGDTLVTVSSHIVFSDAKTGRTEKSFRNDKGTALFLSLDGRFLITRPLEQPKMLLVTELETGKKRTFEAKEYGIAYAALSPDGKWLAFAEKGKQRGDNIVRVLEYPTGRHLWNDWYASTISELFFSPDSRVLAVSGGTTLYDVKTHRKIAFTDFRPSRAFTPNGKALLYNRSLWPLEYPELTPRRKRTPLHTFRTKDESAFVDVLVYAFAPDGRFIAFAGTHCIYVWPVPEQFQKLRLQK